MRRARVRIVCLPDAHSRSDTSGGAVRFIPRAPSTHAGGGRDGLRGRMKRRKERKIIRFSRGSEVSPKSPLEQELLENHFIFLRFSSSLVCLMNGLPPSPTPTGDPQTCNTGASQQEKKPCVIKSLCIFLKVHRFF